ncbi:MAG: alkaline phosphatase family protein, partial [Anaerolineae bacterium]|nr:alkaline phosphatase family protein [Anaerolineae bacterium]
GTAALITGESSRINGVADRAVRNTDLETLFDAATTAGLRVAAVEGESLAFNLRSAEITLSGDRDGNGRTDDNVLRNALQVINNRMPELLYVHFHGIDDAGHTYGPGAPEEIAVIREVDAAVGEIIGVLPADTTVFIFADHGMHSVEEQGRRGNHGHLTAEDMFIPIFGFQK